MSQFADPRPRATRSRGLTPWGNLGLAILSCCLAAGCVEEIDERYGIRANADGGGSLNGTAILGDLFERAGHDVSSTTWLSPRVGDRADVIVWFPDSCGAPSENATYWLETWLTEGEDRTLIYVGRDFDAAAWYWREMQKNAPADQMNALRQREASAQARYMLRRRQMPADEETEWFVIQGRSQIRKVTTLEGDPSWLAGIDASRTEIELDGRLVPLGEARRLLYSGDDTLVSEQHYGSSKVLVVTNGSFLLNAMLVNHEHRKLAGKLVSQVGSPRRVVFLDSTGRGPDVLDSEPKPAPQNGMDIFGISPFGEILLQLACVGAILCMSRFPIFGVPIGPEPSRISDFGRHVWALGKLLAFTRDASFAKARQEAYWQQLHRDPATARSRSSERAPPSTNPPRPTTTRPNSS